MWCTRYIFASVFPNLTLDLDLINGLWLLWFVCRIVNVRRARENDYNSKCNYFLYV